ncbi:N-acetylmuramidase domain-containing protein [Porifericola rhodea]|uniref:N-acetylmuramidase domain-containing protein n=1 Tax=Porifericola rhodea TaxID=930972 RepID=UPI002665248C|nr:N-acetylmuramidase domain-containing protein [Porifericola rhodea]WKN33295.1 N-acetylmuramidase domain-containing protein [Porifericola rhodea]
MKTSPRVLMWVHIAFILAIALTTLVFVIVNVSAGPDKSFALALIAVSGLSLIYASVYKYYSTKVKGQRESGNPYHKFFFTGTNVLTLLLTILGILGGLFVYIEHENLFQAVGLVISIIWIAVFLRYFMWAVYNYNINYGLTDKDWEKIFEARELVKLGYPVSPEELQAPDKNPYRSQTFGLPPGTVRGMIAFTLLFGGLSLLIVSFGSEYSANQLALVRQQFEFFETAFLMMIAFYFGDKSLRYLQKRWVQPGKAQGDSSGDTKGLTPSDEEASLPLSNLEMDDLSLQQEEREFSLTEGDKKPTSISQMRKLLSVMAPEVSTKEVADIPQTSFVQIRDNLFAKVLSDEEIEKALIKLREEEQLHLSMPVVKAIIEVESTGRGHLADGRPKILFEGHKFWYWLKQAGKSEEEIEELAKDHPNILYKKWTTQHYRKGAKEYERLAEAKGLKIGHAAIYSASWGLFQILGENLAHNIKGRIRPEKVSSGNNYYYKDAEDFEQKQEASEYYHFLDFLEFIKTKQTKGKALIDYISEDRQGDYDWASFAYGYNGRGYKTNKYDTRLKAAYEKFSLQYGSKDKKTASIGFIPIIDAGHGGFKDDVYTTKGKQYHFSDGTTIYEGEVNRKIGKLLMGLLDEAKIPYHNLTVDTFEDVSLRKRVDDANALYTKDANHYFLSIHSNAASAETEGEGHNARGFEVWTSVGETKSDLLASIAAKWYKQEFPDFKFRQDMSDGDEDKEKKAQSQSFYVLRKTRCPAFLVENLFYDNLHEARFLLSEHGQARIARCLFHIVKEIHHKYRA